MPRFEYNFTGDQLELILKDPAERNRLVTDFDPFTMNDYIRMTVFSDAGEFMGSFNLQSKPAGTDYAVHPNAWYSDWERRTTGDREPDVVKDGQGNILVKPNDVLQKNGFAEGNYELQFDFLRPYSFKYRTDWSKREEKRRRNGSGTTSYDETTQEAADDTGMTE